MKVRYTALFIFFKVINRIISTQHNKYNRWKLKVECLGAESNFGNETRSKREPDAKDMTTIVTGSPCLQRTGQGHKFKRRETF